MMIVCDWLLWWVDVGWFATNHVLMCLKLVVFLSCSIVCNAYHDDTDLVGFDDKIGETIIDLEGERP